MERECNKCIHHTSGMCSSWDCKMQTVEDVKKESRAQAITEFAERVKRYVDCGHLCHPTELRWSDFSVTEMIDRIATELKGE